MRIALSLVVAVLLLAPVFTGPLAQVPQDFSAIDRYLEAQMRAQRIPGMALVLVSDGQVVYLKGYGEAAPGRAVTAQTPFILGSTSKSFTALVVMQLVEAGKIDLDAPVKRYLPSFTLLDPQIAERITVRHLLNQTSGLPNAAGENMLADRDTSPSGLERKVHDLRWVKPAHEPGTVFEYCNANYDILGLIIQTVSGAPYGEYIQEQIFIPLGMRHAYTDQAAAQRDGLAAGYRYWFGLPFPAGDTPYSTANQPSGKLIASAEDLGPYLLAHLDRGEANGARVLSQTGMDTLHHPALDGYAMGWLAQDGLLIHDGAVPGYGSSFVLDPYRKTGIALLWNVNTGGMRLPAYGLALNIWRLLTRQPPNPLPADGRYASTLAMLTGLLVLEAIWLVVSSLLLRRWRAKPFSRVRKIWVAALAGLLQAGLGIILIAILAQQQRPADVLFLFAPDLMTLAAVFLALAFGWAGLFPVLALKSA